MMLLLPLYMGLFSRMAGGGFGAKYLDRFKLTWLPEVLFCLPFAYAVYEVFGLYALGVLAFVISYLGMQSATWPALKWETSPNRYPDRSATLMPFVDALAKPFKLEVGDEGYSWLWMAVKGFIITLPVGGITGALLWPLGYEIGSHAKGRVEQFGLDPHGVSEFMAGVGAGISILIFMWVL
jgi:hypothetical protein